MHEDSTYLTSGDKLQRTQGGLQVLGVALEIIQSIGERGLQFGGVLSRRRVGSDLVEGSHDCALQTGFADPAAAAASSLS